MNEICIYVMISQIFPELSPFLVKCFGMVLTKDPDLITEENIQNCIQNSKSETSGLQFITFEE